MTDEQFATIVRMVEGMIDVAIKIDRDTRNGHDRRLRNLADRFEAVIENARLALVVQR